MDAALFSTFVIGLTMQAGADMERVNEILKVLPLEYVEMEPGDALFFHPNLLRRSDQNKSPNARWSMICCYNAARHNPYKEAHHPRYTPLKKVEDSAILEAGNKRFSDDANVGPGSIQRKMQVRPASRNRKIDDAHNAWV